MKPTKKINLLIIGITSKEGADKAVKILAWGASISLVITALSYLIK
jgi:hypothetical protein